jgi:hypothetical protein
MPNMNQSISFFLVIFSLLNFRASAQFLNGERVQESDLSDWSPNDISDFHGLYKFGDNIQSNVTFRIIEFKSSIVVQVESFYKYEAGSNWEHSFMNLSKPRIDENGIFSCDEFIGEFVAYTELGEKINLLKINEAFTFFDDLAYELGSRIGNTNFGLKGLFTKASTELLNSNELSEESANNLKLMRNEIFARYGYIFKEGGEMEEYFRKQEWYKAEQFNVNPFLTELEKANIKLIRNEEAKR